LDFIQPLDNPIPNRRNVAKHPKKPPKDPQQLENIVDRHQAPMSDWIRLYILWKNHMENRNVDDTISTFEFPIGDIPRQAPMKNIPLSGVSSLVNFHGLTSEDPNTF